MRIDVVSIFPDYLAPLELTLPGKARDKGLLDVHVHDLRDWAHDRHRTVDDTPYGGGAGMVMKPEPWGEALDARGTGGATDRLHRPRAGSRSPRRSPASCAAHEHLVFAVRALRGHRPARHRPRRDRIGTVREISLGDYVLNGGEVAALAITEAVVRLLPGFMGNAESLVEESHEDGLLEYPVYTKPASWRGLDVPDVLLSGDHGADRRLAPRAALAAHGRAASRPAARPAAVGPADPRSVPAAPGRRRRALTLQRACWVQEPQANPGVEIPALHESLDDVRRGLGDVDRLRRPRAGRGRLARCRPRHGWTAGATWDIGRLMVAPDLQGRGLGRALLAQIEAAAPPDVTSYVLFTGAGSADNLRMYKKAGYRLRPDRSAPPGAVVLTKPRAISRRTLTPLWQTRPLVQSANVARRTTPGIRDDTCHRGCATPPASIGRTSRIRHHPRFRG